MRTKWEMTHELSFPSDAYHCALILVWSAVFATVQLSLAGSAPRAIQAMSMPRCRS
ncbi:MAG: hypothetical protein RJB13_1347 [Pseudomonadota bacterium]